MTIKVKKVHYIGGDEVTYKSISLDKRAGIFEAKTFYGGLKLIPVESVSYIEDTTLDLVTLSERERLDCCISSAIKRGNPVIIRTEKDWENWLKKVVG